MNKLIDEKKILIADHLSKIPSANSYQSAHLAEEVSKLSKEIEELRRQQTEENLAPKAGSK